jgi:4-amino-4-deoxy-L-arabinose transferase-like glycosyltransferase
MAQPLLWLSGGNPWAFTTLGLVMALIGIVCTCLLARRFVGTGSTVMVVLLVEAFPRMAREAPTFMTDVPAYALTMLCLLLGTRWLQGDGRRITFVASLGPACLP